MSVTVPRAGIIGGRSASVQVATPATGSVVEAFGAQLKGIGDALEGDRLDREGQRLSIDLTRDLGNLRNELSQIGDPDQLDQAWEARSAALRDAYLQPGDNGRSRVDPKLQPRFGLMFDELAGKHALALGSQGIALRQSQREAMWVEQRHEIVTQGAQTDADTRDTLIGQADAAIDARVAGGLTSPEAAAKEKLEVRAEIMTARATAAISADPAAFIAAANAGEYNAIPAEQRATKLAQAQNAIEAQDAAQTVTIGRRLDDMTALLSKGLKITDEDYLDDPRVQAHPKYGEVIAAQALRDELPLIETLSVAQLSAQIAIEKDRPKTYKYQAERLAVLEKWRDERATKWRDNPIGAAREAGQPVPDLPAFDPAHPADFAEGLAGRYGLDYGLNRTGQADGPVFFDPQDKAALKTVMDPKADAGAKSTLAAAFVSGTDGDPDRALKAADASLEFTRAAHLLQTTKTSEVATAILRGEQKIALGTVNLPNEKDRRGIFDEVTNGVFDSNPALKAEILAGATALYADVGAGINPDGSKSLVPFMDDTEAVEAFTASIQRALGAQEGGVRQAGGLRDVHGAPTYLPANVVADDADAALEHVESVLGGLQLVDINGGRAYVDPQAPGLPAFTPIGTVGDPYAPLRAAGEDGAIPDLGTDPAGRFANVHLRRVGESDLYELVYSDGGREWTVPRKDDPRRRAYRLNLQQLLREVP